MLAVAAALVMLCGAAAQAGIILGVQDWDITPAEGLGNWTTAGTAATLSENTTDPNNHWLQISFPAAVDPEPGPHWDETVRVPAADLFVGTWDTSMWISFDFWAESSVPETLQVRWAATDSDFEWGYSLSGVSIGSWTRFTAPLSDWESWKLDPFANVDAYLNDLETINWIGVAIERSGSLDAEVYGLDDFALMVPEPAEIALLLAAVMAVGLTVLKRRLPVVQPVL